MLRFFPGIAGAAGAFAALKLVASISSLVLWLEIVIYGAVYVALAIVVDRAMARYGRRR